MRVRFVAEDGGGKYIPGDKEMSMNGQIAKRVGVHFAEYIRRVKQPKPAYIQNSGNGGVGDESQRRHFQQDCKLPRTGDVKGTQQKRDGPRQRHQQRSQHAEEEMADHMGNEAGMGLRRRRCKDPDDGGGCAGQPEDQPMRRPSPSPSMGPDKGQGIEDGEARHPRSQDAGSPNAAWLRDSAGTVHAHGRFPPFLAARERLPLRIKRMLTAIMAAAITFQATS